VSPIERRRFLLTAGATLVGPLVGAGPARASTLYTIGFVSPVAQGARDEALMKGLREHGYVEGRNVHVEMRFADGKPERLPDLVGELVAQKVDVLVVGATIGARAAKRATTTIPIVFAGSSDPVAGGIVTNLRHPGGNITGISLAYGDGFAGKWIELLNDAVPGLARAAVLWSSSNKAASRFVNELRLAARKLGIALDVHHAKDRPQLDTALSAIGSSDVQGLVVTPSPFAASQRRRLVAFAAQQRLPAIYFFASFANAGGLMTYGPDIADAYRRAAFLIDKVLKGAKPGDLPVERASKFELIVNLKAAQTIGLTIPPAFLLRADRVIE